MCKKAWIYSRIAREPDKHLAMQTAYLRQYAADNGLEIIGISEERFSGRIMERPGLAGVEQAAQQGHMDILLVHSISRIARTRDVNAWINKIIDCGVEVRAIKEGLTKEYVSYTESIIAAIQGCYCSTDEPSGSALMELYWEIGRNICLQGETAFVAYLVYALGERNIKAPGFSLRNVRRMRDFYRAYENSPNLMADALMIGWTQNVVIMEACEREAANVFLFS